MLNSIDMVLLKKVGVSQFYQGSGVSMFVNKSRSQPSLSQSLVLKHKKYPVQVHVYSSTCHLFFTVSYLFQYWVCLICWSHRFFSLFSGVMQPEDGDSYSRGSLCHFYKYLLVFLYDH